MKFILKLSLATVSALLFVSCDKQNSTSPQTETLAATNAVVAAAKPNPLFEKLVGRWERTDGDYALELRSVDAEGKFDASYLNPGKINVERAQAVIESGATKVFAVLRDVNYPGCTYKLTYDAKTDQLTGEYFQAAIQETYQVILTRSK